MPADTFYRIVQFTPEDGSGPANLLLESPWKLTAGLKPDFNRAIVNYVEYKSLSGLGIKGSIDFFYSDDESADFTIDKMMLLDAEVAEYGVPSGQTETIAVKYRLIFADSRYAFVEPRGGRLTEGLLNPSTIITPDPARTNVPATITLAGLIDHCTDAMGITVNDYTQPQQKPPNDLKWFGTHAPTELGKLLAMGDMVFLLQPDGSYELQMIGDGDDPTIPTPVPQITLSGADGRGKTVVFTSFPTQIAATLTENDLSNGDWQVVQQNVNGAWVPIDSSGMYGTSSAITCMNAHFNVACNATNDPQLQEGCYRFMRLNPNPYDPIISPLLRKTWDAPSGTPSDPDPGSDTNNPNQLPPQIDIDFRASVAVFNSSSGQWTMPGSPVRVPIRAIHDGNVIETGLRLVKLKSGVTSTADLEGNCVAIDLDTDIQIRFSIGMSTWDATHSIFIPAYYYCGFQTAGTGGTPAQLASMSAAVAAMNDPETIVIPIAELVAVQYGLTEDPYNKTALDTLCSNLAARYLKDSSSPPRQLAGVGFFDFGGMNGTIAEVEIDQQQLMTRFKVDSWWRPAGSYLASEFNRLRRNAESHPHEAKTAGVRSARGEAGSSQPVAPVRAYSPGSNALLPFSLFAVNLNQSGGSNGTQTSASSYTYDMFNKSDGTQIGTAAYSVECARYSFGAVTAATHGSAYYDSSQTPHLFTADEKIQNASCGS